MKAVTEVASHDTPVFVAEYPRTCCINSEPRKMNEKKALKVKKAERLAATSVRFLSAVAGTSGWLERASIRPVDDQEHRGERDEHHAHRNVDEEHPPPTGPVGQESAGDHADRRRRPAHGAEDPEGPVPRLPLGEGDGEDGERGRRDQGGAEALEPAGCDQEPG